MSMLLALIQILLVPVLLVVALAVRFAGASRPLNIVDYDRVDEPDRLHRWAGHRLLVLPIAFLASGLTSFRYPMLSVALFAAMLVALLTVGILLASGAGKFEERA